MNDIFPLPCLESGMTHLQEDFIILKYKRYLHWWPRRCHLL